MVSSFCRCPTHNARVGGIPDSVHQKGCAVDLMCREEGLRARLVRGWIRIAEARGWTVRIELGADYVHVEHRDLPETIWYNLENFRAHLG